MTLYFAEEICMVEAESSASDISVKIYLADNLLKYSYTIQRNRI